MPAVAARYLRVEGDHHELGFQHGEAHREHIEAFLGDRCARIDLLRPTPLPESELERQLECYWQEVQRHLPDVARELAGLAQGARIPLKLACLLQFRRELIGYRKVPTLGDCSTIAARGAQPYVAQTIDLSGDMSPLATVVHTKGAAVGSPDILMFTFKGLLGYLGMNSAGLCVGINVVLSGEWGPGISPYLTVRQMLACHSVDECLKLIRSLPHASSRSFTLLDRHRLVAVEFAAGTVNSPRTPIIFSMPSWRGTTRSIFCLATHRESGWPFSISTPLLTATRRKSKPSSSCYRTTASSLTGCVCTTTGTCGAKRLSAPSSCCPQKGACWFGSVSPARRRPRHSASNPNRKAPHGPG
jgi:predicted choloylglycine hydrolase